MLRNTLFGNQLYPPARLELRPPFRRLEERSVLVRRQNRGGGRGRYRHERVSRSIKTPAATATFKELAPGRMGIVTRR